MIARTQPVSKTSVIDTFHAADERGVAWEDVEGMPDAEAYALLFPERAHEGPVYRDPDWDRVHRELARVGVTLKRLHEEYRDDARSKGEPFMSYDRFCKRYREFTVRKQVVSRVGHKAGRILEVDWAGPTMRLVDPATGEVSKVYLFVACLPFSRMSYVEPTLDMKQDTWLRCHVHAFAYLGGSTPCIVPDNLKAGVESHPREGEVVLNGAYREMAAHYGSAVMPARVATPRDKPSAENEVWQAALEIVAALRDTVFTDFNELKRAVAERLEEHNARPFAKREGTRRQVFEEQERPLLRPLPAVPYEVCEWIYGRKVQRNCHVAYRRNYYSVSHLAVGKTVDLRVTDSTVEVFLGGERLATHPLFPAYARNRYSTHAGDLPGGRSYSDWDAGRIRRWADRVGPSAGRWWTASSNAWTTRSRASTRPSRRSGSSTATPGPGSSAPARWRWPRAGRLPGTSTLSRYWRPARTWPPGRAPATTAAPATTRPATCAARTSTGRRRAMELSMETKRKLRDMGAADLLGALEAQDEGMCMGMTCAERVQMAVDEAHSVFVTSKVRNLTKRANLRYPEADVRSVRLLGGARPRPAAHHRARHLRLRRARAERGAAGADRHRQDLPRLRDRQGRVPEAECAPAIYAAPTWRSCGARRASAPAERGRSRGSTRPSRCSCSTSGCSTGRTSSSGASCSSSWRLVTARPPRSSAHSSARRTGTPGSAAASTPMPSWTASSTAPHGSTWAR